MEANVNGGDAHGLILFKSNVSDCDVPGQTLLKQCKILW